MNEYLFFTQEGDTFAPNVNVDVDNCQLLGRIRALSPKDALKLLLIDNPWIDKAGFTEGAFIQEQIITEEQRSCIRVIVDNLYKRRPKAFDKGYQLPASVINSLRILNEMVDNPIL